MFSCNHFVLCIIYSLTLCFSSCVFLLKQVSLQLACFTHTHTWELSTQLLPSAATPLFYWKNLQGSALNRFWRGDWSVPQVFCMALLAWQVLLYCRNKYYVCKMDLHLQIIFWSRCTLSLLWGWTNEPCWCCWKSRLKLILINKKKKSGFIGNTEQKWVIGKNRMVYIQLGISTGHTNRRQKILHTEALLT